MRAATTMISALLLPSALLFTACAHRPPASDPDALAEYRQANDPLEPTNRVLYRVNEAIDAVILKPIALAYHYGLPDPVQHGIHNVLGNLNSPVLFANDVMQGNGPHAGNTAMRFLINTTLGVVGIFDVANDMGYHPHDTDFGITMALWGVPSGPFLFLPLLGPSDPRDASGYGVDVAIDPFTWVGQGATVSDLQWGRYGATLADSRAAYLKSIDDINNTALDPYATFRSLYRQHRAAEIQAARASLHPAAAPPAKQPQAPNPLTSGQPH